MLEFENLKMREFENLSRKLLEWEFEARQILKIGREAYIVYVTFYKCSNFYTSMPIFKFIFANRIMSYERR
jgi:hypothetical protein